MSLSKRIFFSNDPADDEARRRLDEQTRRRLSPFKFKIPTRRRNRLSTSPYWDPMWQASLIAAAKELTVETVFINDQMCVRTREEAEAIRARAEAIHRAKTEKFLQWVAQSSDSTARGNAAPGEPSAASRSVTGDRRAAG